MSEREGDREGAGGGGGGGGGGERERERGRGGRERERVPGPTHPSFVLLKMKSFKKKLKREGGLNTWNKLP